jgi:NADH dehydrogenase
MTPIHATSGRPRVVIIGAGFGGLSAAKQLARAPFDVTIVDRHNYHLFQPLLYQVATAGLSPGDIASPIHGILHGQRNAKVILAKVSGIGTTRREVVAEGRRIPYDFLVIATGAEHAYFGHDWASYAPGLKTIDDATYLRRRILLAFERAETEPDADERRRLLNFVVVGGGPTGVEMAGAIAELAKRALAADFRSIDPRCARIILIEAGPRLLAPFDPSLSEAHGVRWSSSASRFASAPASRSAIAPESRSAKRACKREPLFGRPASKPPQWPNGSAPTVIAPAA